MKAVLRSIRTCGADPRSSRCVDRVSTVEDGETSALQEPVALTQGVHVVLIESALCKMVKPPPYKNLWR